LVRSPPPPHK
jgi:hypothetical protein